MASSTQHTEASQAQQPPQGPAEPPHGPAPAADPEYGTARAVWAWLMLLLLEPLLWIAAANIGFGIALYQADTGENAGIGAWLLFGLLLGAAPAIAFPVALQAARWGSIAGIIALAVSGLLLIATLVLLAVAGLWLWVIAWVVVVGLLTWLVWTRGRKPPPRVRSGEGIPHPRT